MMGQDPTDRSEAIDCFKRRLATARSNLAWHTKARDEATDSQLRESWQMICEHDESTVDSCQKALEQCEHGAFLPNVVAGNAETFRLVADGKARPLTSAPFAIEGVGAEIDSIECDNVHRSNARSCLREVELIEAFLTEEGVDPGLLADLASYAYSAGRFRERCDSDAANQRAITEGKRRLKLAESATDQQSDVRDLWAEYQAGIDSRCPEVSYAAAVRAVAVDHGVSERTVRKRTTNRHPRNGGPGRN